MEIWHNTRCSKSRAACSLLDERGVEYRVRDYLAQPPTVAELDVVLTRLGLEPWDVARTHEPVAAEVGLADLPRERTRWIEVMVANPVLIQRPIILTDDGRAVLGRSEDAVRGVL
ncbi:MAG: arsenate reductase family protein [Actinomycetes bacterium]